MCSRAGASPSRKRDPLLEFIVPFHAEILFEGHLAGHEDQQRGAHAERGGRDGGNTFWRRRQTFCAAGIERRRNQTVDVQVDIAEIIQLLSSSPAGKQRSCNSS